MPEPHLALLHTGKVHIDSFAKLFAVAAPDIPLYHVVRADLLAAAEAAGGMTPEIAQDTAEALRRAKEGSVACVLCTCSTLGPAVESAAAETQAPYLRVDRALAEQAVSRGNCILVVAAVETTTGPTVTLLREAADNAGRAIDIDTLVLPEAWVRFQAGNQPGYLQAIAQAVREKLGDADLVVLAQASMAGAADLLADLGVPVLASPTLAVERAVRLYRELAKSA